MLMIERRPGSTIVIGDDVRIHVREIKRRNSVRIGVEAPRYVPVVRGELARDRAKSLSKTGRRDFRVWVIEDDDAHAEIIGGTLKRCGVDAITVFPTGRAVFDAISEDPALTPPDLILLDLRLPDTTGIDVLERLRGCSALTKVPVVVLSSTGEDEFVEQSLERGANAFVQKSTEYDDFKSSIIRITEFWSQTRRVA